MRHGPRDRDLAAIFEPDGEATSNIAVSYRSARARNSRRPREASPANCLFRCLQRQSAHGAARAAKKLDSLPAIGTEAMYVGGDGAAAGTSRRQRKVQ